MNYNSIRCQLEGICKIDGDRDFSLSSLRWNEVFSGTFLSPLWDEMKFSPVLYRFFDFFSLRFASGKPLLFKQASLALLPEEDDSFYIFLAGLFSRIVRSFRFDGGFGLVSMVSRVVIRLIMCLMWRMSSRIVRLMLSDDLKLSGDGAWMVSEGFLIVWVMASFLDEVSTSRFDALRWK